jgi:hypothetical protein
LGFLSMGWGFGWDVGEELEAYLKENGPFDRVIYVGDGGNDFCPLLRLKAFVLLAFLRPLLSKTAPDWLVSSYRVTLCTKPSIRPPVLSPALPSSLKLSRPSPSLTLLPTPLPCYALTSPAPLLTPSPPPSSNDLALVREDRELQTRIAKEGTTAGLKCRVEYWGMGWEVEEFYAEGGIARTGF